jgi:hypothetical protein
MGRQIISCVILVGPDGCLDVWSNNILSVSVRMFLEEISIWIKRLSKADCLPDVGGPHPVKTLIRARRMNKREMILPDCLSWDIGLFGLADLKNSVSSLLTFWLELPSLAPSFSGHQSCIESTHHFSWVSSLLTADLFRIR